MEPVLKSIGFLARDSWNPPAKSVPAHELNGRGIAYVRQLGLPLHYKGIKLDCGYRVGLLVESNVGVEIKSVNELTDVHKAQLLTYLRISGWPLDLLVNFNVSRLRRGIKRLMHT